MRGVPGGPGWAAGFLHCLLGRPFLTVSQKLHEGCFWDTLCFHIGVCIWALLSQPPTSPGFSVIDVMAAGCAGLHQHQGGREGGRSPTPQVSFRELTGPPYSLPGLGGVAWVLADVVSDIHLATMTSPWLCRPGPSWAMARPKV